MPRVRLQTLLMRNAVPLATAFALVLLAVAPADACSWARGYFHQVTQLRGNVVGARLGPLQYARWLRQSFSRRNVKLALYEYRWPIAVRNEMPLVKTTHTDRHGSFDFGLLLPGHYALVLDDEDWGSSEWFDVEIRSSTRETASVSVDISPHFPSCGGGHEFVVNSR
jgi:hypothetical protein